ncbi:VOC family protein [Enteractinococcus helveticum]|uniref:Glyoxalase n=1 Tax=Enteractinococcus helveticum TaxID=1837282 RepID=A0A1B7LWJ2_9MICC|nr:VOC family protein [Enteractinococcus helveticum]OAV59412.1 glyoxalase [Enteractinococcus helveticum]
MAEQSVDLIISMGIADRQRSMNFYMAAFDFELIGEPLEDGVPEPLQFRLNDHTRLMLIPNDGFDWVLDKHTNAPAGVNESILGLPVEAAAHVDKLVERIITAGGTVITAAAQQAWGYTALCADPDGHVWQITAV